MSRPPKARGGLSKVLFVRVPRELLKRLDALLAARREERPGHNVSRADLVREMIHNGLEEEHG